MIRVMLVDDQLLLREGLKTIINLQDDMKVVCEAQNGNAAVLHMADNDIDVILMDIQMPELNGVEATKIIKEGHRDVSIIILTTFDDDDYIIDALSNGADGYLLKDIDALHLIRAIQDAYNGVLMVPARIATKLAARISGGTKKGIRSKNDIFNSPFELTEREKEIALLMVENLGNRQIAKKLFLTEGTVKNYISEIYSKLGTNDREQAVLLLTQKHKDMS